MDTQNDVGSEAAFRKLLYYTNIRYGEFNECVRRLRQHGTYASVERFAALLEAVAQGDRAEADQVLREWGIR